MGQGGRECAQTEDKRDGRGKCVIARSGVEAGGGKMEGIEKGRGGGEHVKRGGWEGGKSVQKGMVYWRGRMKTAFVLDDPLLYLTRSWYEKRKSKKKRKQIERCKLQFDVR
mmetsp:Transcript_15204/g.38395  ORF Transcript_15204/g.38395 Transcript_15204/m.38395 type:complete len:111 (+) Transcript_15204:802-1134(+)